MQLERLTVRSGVLAVRIQPARERFATLADVFKTECVRFAMRVALRFAVPDYGQSCGRWPDDRGRQGAAIQRGYRSRRHPPARQRRDRKVSDVVMWEPCVRPCHDAEAPRRKVRTMRTQGAGQGVGEGAAGRAEKAGAAGQEAQGTWFHPQGGCMGAGRWR